jgi:hypothetical protein
MTTTPQPESPALEHQLQIVSAGQDLIKIVPLHLPGGETTPVAELAESASAAPPHLVYNQGPLLANVQVFTIFWGAKWRTQAPLMQKINAFFDYVLTSPLIDQLAEYSVPKYTIGHGKRIGTTLVTTPSPSITVTDSAIRHFLQQEISTNTSVPKPTPNTLYFVYVQPGVKVVQGGSASCQAFCGYHDAISSGLFYAVMPYPGCSGCTGGLAPADALTSTSSHELCEAITDPVPGQGWYDQANGEIGDICAWKTKQLGGYTVQLEWSNQHNSCL